ncbi:MAG TPA: hypothetical protein DCR04_02980 [Flavobacteriales bacterium]|nr:hypothetical protein [Flavobacteriales bacterium]
MRNVDRVLYSLDSNVKEDSGYDSFDTGIIEYRGDNEFVDGKGYSIGDKHPGNYVMDARIGFQVAEWLKAAFIVNNLINREYSLRPLKMEQPRTASIQFTVKV